MIPFRRPGALGGFVPAGRGLAQPEARWIVRSNVFVGNWHGRVRDRTVPGQSVEVIGQDAQHPRHLAQHPASRTELAPVVGDAELGLVRLPHIRGAPVGSWLGVGPAPGEEPDRSPAEAGPGQQPVVCGSQVGIELGR